MGLAGVLAARDGVLEIFNTIQGEGPHTGRFATFVRFSNCNLQCSWCDTPYTWRFEGPLRGEFVKQEQQRIVPLAELIARVAVGGDLIVLTGGEPLMQKEVITALIDRYPMRSFQIETNGTIAPLEPRSNVSYVASPKLMNSNNRNAIKISALQELAERGADFKFVVESRGDVQEAADLVTNLGIKPSKVWLMAEGTHADDLLSQVAGNLADEAISRGWNFSTRLHVLLWGNERMK